MFIFRQCPKEHDLLILRLYSIALVTNSEYRRALKMTRRR